MKASLSYDGLYSTPFGFCHGQSSIQYLRPILIHRLGGGLVNQFQRLILGHGRGVADVFPVMAVFRGCWRGQKPGSLGKRVYQRTLMISESRSMVSRHGSSPT